MQVTRHVKRFRIEQNMVIAHVYQIRNKPCVDDGREREQPSFVAQQEGNGGEEHRCPEFAHQHRYRILRRGLQCQFTERKMVEEQGLTEDEQCE